MYINDKVAVAGAGALLRETMKITVRQDNILLVPRVKAISDQQFKSKAHFYKCMVNFILKYLFE